MSSANDTPRFVALDLHKRYVMVGAVNAHQEVVLRPQRLELGAFETWARKHLRPTDEVVLEATSNAWYIYDLLEPLVAEVVVANPYHVKLIAASMVKTDRRDTLVLARLLAAKLIPEVWIPPVEVRELRALIAHRERLVSQQTATKNRLQGVLHRHQIVPPAGKLFSQANRTWWTELGLLPSEKLRLLQDLATLDHLAPQLTAVETELARLSTVAPWAAQVAFLIQLPGIGLIIAMTILSAIGEISRFPAAKKLVGDRRECWLGCQGACLRSDPSGWGNYQTRPAGIAGCPGRSRLGRGQHPSRLGPTVREANRPYGQTEGHRRYRPQIAGGGLARPDLSASGPAG
jgi:transposase